MIPVWTKWIRIERNKSEFSEINPNWMKSFPIHIKNKKLIIIKLIN